MVIREVLYKNNKELWTCPEQLSVNVIFIERLKYSMHISTFVNFILWPILNLSKEKANASREPYFRLNHCLKTFTGNTSSECEH